MNGPSWFKQVRGCGVLHVARAFGVQVNRDRTLSCPAPSCGADRRASSGDDQRGPVGLKDGHGWFCHRCKVSGDPVTLAAYVVTGEPKPAHWTPVQDACADLNLCDQRPTRGATATPRAPRPVFVEPPHAPPVRDVPGAQGLWQAAQLVGDSAEAMAWLGFRGLDWGDVELYDLARALSADAQLASWARRGGVAWNRAPQMYRLIVPLYDARGVLTSVHARAVALPEVTSGEKAAFPLGLGSGGLVMACPLAVRMLAGDPLALELVKQARPEGEPGVLIAEGVPDFLSWATRWSDADELAPAVLAVVSGAWSAEFSDRIPDGAHVLVATHDDQAGDRYAETIHTTLASRIAAGHLTAAHWAPSDVTP
jgi:hypothetical protein